MDTLLQRLYYKLRDKMSRPDESGKKHSGYWQGKVRDEALHLCQGATGRFLEVGCGEGIFISALVKSNSLVQVWGADASDDMLGLAQASLPAKELDRVHFVKSQAQKLPFGKDTFDTVVAVNLFICLHGIEEAHAVIMEAARVMKPGGRFIAEFRNKANPVLWLKYKLAGFYDATLKDHPLSTYDIKQMKAVFSLAGFSVEKEIYLEFPNNRMAPIVLFEAKKHA